MKATWKGQVLAESDDIVTVEGNAYFPADSIRQEFFRPSNTHSNCPWKGEASYYSIEVEGETNGVVLPEGEGSGEAHRGPDCLLARGRDLGVGPDPAGAESRNGP